MNPTHVLAVADLSSGYGDLPVLEDVGFTAVAGSVVVIAGANGAGKSTLLNTLMGVVPAWRGRIEVAGTDVTAMGVADRMRHGIGHVPEGRGLFAGMTVRENLRLGGRAIGARGAALTRAIDAALVQFPELDPKLRQKAGNLSGGEQQMLSLARALVARPRILLLDEPSTGLAPRIWSQLLRQARALADDGTLVLLAEQRVRPALVVADRCVILRHGRIAFDGPAASALTDRALIDAYLEQPQHAGEPGA